MKAVNLEKMLPADIPPGERVLWFGRPEPVSLMRRAWRADWIAGWFGLVVLWNGWEAAANDGLAAGVLAAVRAAGFGCVGLAIVAGLAWVSARTTLYVLTEKRLVLKVGMALPIFINVPFKQVVAADLRVFADGVGDVTLTINREERVPYLALWPSARPFHFTRPQPALRSIPNARDVAATLGRALAEANGQNQPNAAPAPRAVEPGRIHAVA
jgi:hypothetical protein